MLLRAIFFILYFPPLFLTGFALDHLAHHVKDAPPSWVKFYDFPLEAVSVKPSQVNVQHLLIDTQRNWDEKTLYLHFAVKTLTQNGVEAISQLHIDFDPFHTQVIVHAIRVFREGKWFDRLENSRSNIIQREKELEQNLYHGNLTLIYFLDDIREDDIIEYSYSLAGGSPFFASHYADMVYLQRDFPVEKIVHRLLGHPDLSFLIKPVNLSIEPKIADLSPSLREWVWEAVDTPAYNYESDQPIWHNPPAHIEMSQYKTWGEIARKLATLYTLPPDFIESAPSEMLALVETWKTSTTDLSKRALLALRFVQDKIRYLGIEEDMGAFQPTSPNVTFQRRFGDCKDKTFLLHALLHLMDIPSKPLLVHSSRGKRLSEMLPMPFLFDHIVLQLEIDSRTYWADPTLSLQGGSLETNFFPNYEWGLLLTENTETLTDLPKTVFTHPTEIDTSFLLESEDSARVTIKSVFHDSRADRFRRFLEWSGAKKISEDSLANMQEIYGAVTLNSPSEILDDRENNILTLTEFFRLPTQKNSDKKMIEIFSYTLRNYLDSHVNPERASPYGISYPLWVKEHVHIESPFIQWTAFEENYTQEHESLFYALSTRVAANSTDFHFELKHLQDHIPQTALRDYWTLVNDIYRNAPPKINVVALQTPGKKVSFTLFCSVAGLVIWPLLYLTSRKKRPTQDFLSFQLGKFRKFSSVIIILTAIFVNDSPAQAATTAIVMTLGIGILCNYVVLQRSVKFSLFLQGFLWFIACILFSYIFTETGTQFSEKILAFIACCLYLGPSSFILHKVKSLLLKEQKATGSLN